MNQKTKSRLISNLKNHKMTMNELKEEFKVSEKTMKNYLKELEDQFIEVDVQKKRGRGRQPLLYHINMLPEVGNEYYISEAPKRRSSMRFGFASDLHIASKYHLPKTLRDSLKRLDEEGIKKVYVAGDIVDGLDIYRGHRENIVTTSIEEQTDLAAELFNEFPNMEFWGIAGNHDYSFTKKDGSKPLAIIESKVDNFKNLGDLRADVVFKGMKIRLLHGGSGRTYARSYPTQVYLRDLFGGSEQKDIRDMPDLLLVGHYHTRYHSKDHGIEVIQPGSFQDGDNEYCIRRGLTGPNGLYLVEFDFQDGIIDEIVTRYIQPKTAMSEKGEGFRKTIRNYRA